MDASYANDEIYIEPSAVDTTEEVYDMVSENLTACHDYNFTLKAYSFSGDIMLSDEVTAGYSLSDYNPFDDLTIDISGVEATVAWSNTPCVDYFSVIIKDSSDSLLLDYRVNKNKQQTIM